MSKFADKLLERIKKTLRQADNEFDDEIGSYIDTCARDLQNVGILASFFEPTSEDWQPDGQILQAVRWYCLSTFGLYNADMEKYTKAYASLKSTLATQRFYTVSKVEIPDEPDVPTPDIPEEIIVSPFGRKLYTFGVLSDIHLTDKDGGQGYNFKNGVDDFNRAIDVLQTLGVDFVCISGDIGYYSRTQELQLYKDAINQYAKVPFYACTGNHDYGHSDQTWESYIGHPLNYEFVQNGDVFLFMGVNQSSTSAELANPYGDYLDWLIKRLARYKDARIFIFMHYPLSGYAGLRDGDYYGFSSTSAEDDKMLAALIDTKNTVVFSGHTHYKFDCEATYDTINVFNFNHKNVSLVHVPSCAYPRNAAHKEEPDLSEGYIVDVYEKGTILKGVDFVDRKLMPDYEYVLTVHNNPSVSQTPGIVLSTNDVSLKSGESVEIEVSLTDPVDVTLNISKDNDYVNISKSTLQFTSSNYSTVQKFIVSAGEFNTSELATITISGDNLVSKTISVSLNYIAEELIPVLGTVLLEDGKVYGGECLSDPNVEKGINQMKIADTATGEYKFKLKNLHLTSIQTGLYLASANTKNTIELEGINTIDTTSATTLTQRAASSSSQIDYNYLTGVGTGAKLTLKGRSNATKQVVKGNWMIENAEVIVEGTDLGVETVTPSVSGIMSGININKSGKFTYNTAFVELLSCDNGYLEVNLGPALSTTTLTITDHPNTGYKLSAIKINGEQKAVNTVVEMPAGTTLTIQGVFTK